MTVYNENYKKRLIDEAVQNALSVSGAVCIEGPKWCGKTWTSENAAESEFMVGDPDNQFQNRRLAQMSPSLVLEGDSPRLIDEWQEVPELWDAVRSEVDKRNRKGQFILTGSSTPALKGICHSGAGRIVRIHMHPMSLWESGHSSGKVSLKDLIEGKFTDMLTGNVELADLASAVIRGGWPANQSQLQKNIGILPRSYMDSFIEYDLPRIEEKPDPGKMKLLLRSLARNESTTVSNNTLIRDIQMQDETKMSKETLVKYLDILKRQFLILNQEPFSPNFRSSLRIKQMEKRHLADPSLAAALLRMTPEKLIHDLNTFGFLFESLCERDLRIYAEANNASLFHYQDYRSNEIDAVIELEDGRWMAFEIKLGANKIDEAAENLKKVNRIIEKEGGRPADFQIVLCGLSNAAYRRPDGIYVIPLTALKA